MPILSALNGLAATSRNRTLAAALRAVVASLEAGHDFATALSQQPKVFSLFYVSLIRVGETSGQLDTMFRQLAYYLEREKSTRDQIKAALRYPKFVLSAIVVAMFLINLLVIPAFASAYARFGAELPWFTQLLIAISNFTVAWWPYLVVGMIAALVGLHMYGRTDEGRYRFDRLRLRIPLIGEVVHRATLARFSRLFAISHRAGVPLITALSLVGRGLDNRYLEERILAMRDGVERGESISRTAAATGVFDHLVLQMIAVGEESGTLEQLLEDVADYYDSEVDYSIKRLSMAIEPMLTVLIGLMVLVLALGVFLPMWDLADAALHK